MKLKMVFMLLLIFFIHCPVIANASSPLGQTIAKPLILQQVGDAFQHNVLLSELTKLQQNLNKNIAMKIRELKQQNNPLLLFSVLGIAFIYGIFHALGPGHGKSIISSWVIAQQRSLRTILLVSVSAAALHALTAALIVGGTYILLGKFAAVSTQQLNAYLQIAGAILVIGIGLSLLIPLVYGKSNETRSNLEQTLSKRPGKPFIVAFSIGVVPCPVTSVILIFCLTLGLIWQGILLVISFAAGMGLSLVAVACLVWSIKEKTTPEKFSAFHNAVINVTPAAGGIFLIVIGSAILYSLL